MTAAVSIQTYERCRDLLGKQSERVGEARAIISGLLSSGWLRTKYEKTAREWLEQFEGDR